MSFLMPTAVRPAVGLCGTYVAAGSSNGDKALSGITQVIYILEKYIHTPIVRLHFVNAPSINVFQLSVKLNTSAYIVHNNEFIYF